MHNNLATQDNAVSIIVLPTFQPEECFRNDKLAKGMLVYLTSTWTKFWIKQLVHSGHQGGPQTIAFRWFSHNFSISFLLTQHTLVLPTTFIVPFINATAVDVHVSQEHTQRSSSTSHSRRRFSFSTCPQKHSSVSDYTSARRLYTCFPIKVTYDELTPPSLLKKEFCELV